MAENQLTEKLQAVFKKLRGYGKLSESNISDAVREVRRALLAADVNYQVAKDFCNEVKEKALGEEVLRAIKPGDQFVKIVNDELIRRFGEKDTAITLDRPLRLLLVGLNGAGKTTTAAKLALHFKKKQKEEVLLVAGDLARPAAIDQLEALGKQIDVPVLAFRGEKSVAKVAREAAAEAERLRARITIFDSAGRLDVDEALLAELAEVSQVWQPQETLLVADAATGQAAVSVAEAFAGRVDLTGLVLSKFDADVRGGAALSIQAVTDVPIKYLGTGEAANALETFAPERLVSRMLGMGDIVGLVEKAQEEFDLENAAQMEEKLKRGNLDLQDFLDQLKTVRKLGPMENLLGMIPGMPKVTDSAVDENSIKRLEAMVLSMTPAERRQPDILNARRRIRIANGSGTSVSDLNDLLRRFNEMKKMMGKLRRGGSPEKMLKKLMGGRRR
ncbi:MAG: signal recognition particle protein [Verrucomicrobiota bacterium]